MRPPQLSEDSVPSCRCSSLAHGRVVSVMLGIAPRDRLEVVEEPIEPVSHEAIEPRENRSGSGSVPEADNVGAVPDPDDAASVKSASSGIRDPSRSLCGGGRTGAAMLPAMLRGLRR